MPSPNKIDLAALKTQQGYAGVLTNIDDHFVQMWKIPMEVLGVTLEHQTLPWCPLRELERT